MRNYSDLEKRLRHIAESDDAKATLIVRFNKPTGEPEWTPFKTPSLSLAQVLTEAAAAIAELTKRCEEEYARGLEDAARIAETAMSRYADYENDPACESAVGAGNEIAAAIRASQRQLPSNPLPNDPANGDENAPAPGDGE